MHALNLYIGATAFSNAFYGMTVGPIHVSNVECTGNETGLIDCVYDSIPSTGCDHSDDAGVLCQGIMYLASSLHVTFKSCTVLLTL